MIPGMMSAGAMIGGTPTPGGDPHWASVVSLLHFDGANGSTVFVDQKGIEWLAEGDAKVTSAAKFGSGAALLDGSDWISAEKWAGLEFGTGDFTIEAWVRTNLVSLSPNILSTRNGSPVGGFTFRIAANGRIQYFYATGTPITQGGPHLGDDSWHHVAYTRSGSTGRLFADGVHVSTVTDTNNHMLSSMAPRIYIGASTFVAGERFNGSIDDLRITKGVARYTSDFTPPTAPFPNGP